MSKNKNAKTPADGPVAWMHTTAAGLVYFRKKPHDKVFSPQAVYTAEQVAAAIAAEREACAKVCEERQEVFQKYYTKGLAAMCAEAIRARGNK
jgi:hypothetical protein